jgi:hypothetical protein
LGGLLAFDGMWLMGFGMSTDNLKVISSIVDKEEQARPYIHFVGHINPKNLSEKRTCGHARAC